MELELPRDFKELFRSFNAHGVEYLVIGGYAVICHGYVRTTQDLDIAVARNTVNAGRIVAALSDFGFGETEVSPILFTAEDSLVRMGVEPVRIEILNYMAGVDFGEAYKRRDVPDVEDIQISLISLPDLIANKKAVGRLRDLADVDELEKINK